jgi:predicted dehydrogenase
MTSLAIVGFGNHVIKNILPTLKKFSDVKVDCIYVRSVAKYEATANQYDMTLADISELKNCKADWVYIATPIATHFELVKQALELGKNVICEKPMTDSSSNTAALLQLAKDKGLKLYEVCMYIHHRQFKFIQELIQSDIQKLRSVHAKFSIPHLDPSDIRYKKEMAGGALLDVGYYPISIILNLFGTPKSKTMHTYSATGYEVDLYGTCLFQYENFYCVAEWGIGDVYRNDLTVFSEQKTIKLDRVFSKPSSLSTSADVIDNNSESTIEIESDDQFFNFFKKVFSGIDFEQNSHEIAACLEDIR